VIAWVLAVVTGFYLLPWAVSATRNRTNVGATALVNLFLGWTLVGWIVALVMACGSERPIVLVQHTYAAPLPPWTPPQQQWTQQQWTPPQWTPQAQRTDAPPALPAGPSHPTYAPEPTVVDPFGNEPTQALPRSPWEPDHRR
jgi:hypothetical protein